ncbi:MAG: hypothetical protein AAB019_06845 [Planctomycetota bacterium]
MRQVLVIANLTYREASRQPLFFIILAASIGLLFIAPHFTLFTFEETEHISMIREVGLATIMVAGLLIAVLSAYFVISAEITNLTTVMLLSKPVKKGHFILGKFLGIIITVIMGMAFLSIIFLIIYWIENVAPQLKANAQNLRYVDNKHLFWSDISAVLTGEILLLLKGVYLSFLQVSIITAVATVLSCHFSLVVTGLGCLVTFMLGHISEFIYQTLSEMDNFFGVIIGNVFYFLLPNLTNFNIVSLVAVLSPISITYLALTTFCCLLYSALILTIGIIIFNKREIM